jgi:hypothetical protein
MTIKNFFEQVKPEVKDLVVGLAPSPDPRPVLGVHGGLALAQHVLQSNCYRCSDPFPRPRHLAYIPM